jgi:hypothetical protein
MMIVSHRQASALAGSGAEQVQLLRDSVYACAGIIMAQAPAAERDASFRDWWNSSLHREVQSESPLQRRRLLQLVTMLHRPLHLRLLLPAVVHLANDRDRVVQLEAIVCLHRLCEGSEQRLPLVDLVAPILAAESRCRELNTHVLVLRSLSTVVGVCDDVERCVGAVIEATPPLWQECDAMNVVRSHLLALLAALVTRLEHRCGRLQSLVMQLLLFATDPANRHLASVHHHRSHPPHLHHNRIVIIFLLFITNFILSSSSLSSSSSPPSSATCD